MKLKNLYLLLGLLMLCFVSVGQAQLDLHYVGGHILNPDGSVPATGEIMFKAFLSHSPMDTTIPAGCASGGGWGVELFTQDYIKNATWTAGDTLVVIFENIAEGPYQGHMRIYRYVTTESAYEDIGNLTLPVELTNFSVAIKQTSLGDRVELAWRTIGETNNLGFEVQRSLDKKHYEKLGFVSGAGSTNVAQGYSFLDETVPVGTWFYRLKQMDRDGAFTFSDVKEIEVMPPQKYELTQNFPNPFNPRTEIAFHIREEGVVELKVFDLLGREVQTLVNQKMQAGIHRVSFDGRDLPTGMYLYTLKAGTYHAVI